MLKYLIDENLPAYLSAWDSDSFIHVSEIPFVDLDSDIWQYALANELIILTKDSDFYFRYLSSKNYPKVVWIKTGNMKKRKFDLFIESIWKEVEIILMSSAFIVVNEEKIQGF